MLNDATLEEFNCKDNPKLRAEKYIFLLSFHQPIFSQGARKGGLIYFPGIDTGFMQTTMVLTQRIMMFMQVTKLLISGNMKGLSWTRLYTHLATISRGAMYVHKMKEKVFDLSESPFSSFICTLLSQSGMVEGTWALASDKPCISQSGTLG